MQRYERWLMAALAFVPVVAAGCSSDIGLPKAPEVLRPDWLSYSGNKEEFSLRPPGPADLVDQDGRCGAGAGDTGPGVDGTAPAPVQGGISLQMTECDVVRRAGTPERVEVGASSRGERQVVLTYTRGVRPGIYRFAAGRLVSIERAPEAAPTRPERKASAKKGA